MTGDGVLVHGKQGMVHRPKVFERGVDAKARAGGSGEVDMLKVVPLKETMCSWASFRYLSAIPGGIMKS